MIVESLITNLASITWAKVFLINLPLSTWLTGISSGNRAFTIKWPLPWNLFIMRSTRNSFASVILSWLSDRRFHCVRWSRSSLCKMTKSQPILLNKFVTFWSAPVLHTQSDHWLNFLAFPLPYHWVSNQPKMWSLVFLLWLEGLLELRPSVIRQNTYNSEADPNILWLCWKL